MSQADYTYHNLLCDILENGEDYEDRTGTGTKSIFGYQMRFDLEKEFPLLTTKRIFWKAIVEELLWFLRGETNVRSLQEKGVHIWDEWADENGDLGPVYGSQWRSWVAPGEYHYDDFVVIDQIANVIRDLRKNPNSRRHIVTAWNPAEVDQMKLPPCHLLFQFSVRRGTHLSCQLYQRSCDTFLGVPFNIASYALLTKMIAHVVGLKAGEFIWTGGDVHIYKNHLEQVEEQLAREPRIGPQVALNPNIDEIDEFRAGDIQLVGYDPHPAIKGDVSV